MRNERTCSAPAASAMSGKRPDPVISVAGKEPDAGGVPADHHAKAVVLDLVNPAGALRRALGGGWKAGLDETGRRPADTQKHTKNRYRASARESNPGGDHADTGARINRALTMCCHYPHGHHAGTARSPPGYHA